MASTLSKASEPMNTDIPEKYQSLNMHRLKQNDYLLHQGDQRHVERASEQFRKVACSVVQWLGSPVGRNFLLEGES